VKFKTTAATDNELERGGGDNLTIQNSDFKIIAQGNHQYSVITSLRDEHFKLQF
jgi:hypothetical protein